MVEHLDKLCNANVTAHKIFSSKNVGCAVFFVCGEDQFDNDLSTVALTLTNSVFLYLSTVLRHRKTELENRIF